MKSFLYLALTALVISSNTVSTAPNDGLNIQQPLLFQPAVIKDCGLPSDIFHLESFTVSPDPPQRGEDLTVDVKGTLDEAIDKGAFAEVRVRLGLIKLVDTKIDLCDEIHNIDRECPVEEGPLHINHTVKLPREIPPGRYQVNVDVTNFDGKHTACIAAEFRI
ncbi:ML domain-containing protein [Gaertneriomyces semiglobifer]|nr:ML domain-containing protein [Gaertneriomyces semiglobifer]